VRLVSCLPTGAIEIGGGKRQHPSASLALAKLLGLNAVSIEFGKVILWIGAFVSDGFDAIGRSSLKDGDRSAALAIFTELSAPFRYPYAGGPVQEHMGKMLTGERMSYMSLLDAYIKNEHPIYIPEPTEISETIETLRNCQKDFSQLDVPAYIKEDFHKTIDLYIIVATHLPMVAHRLVSAESSNLISWLLSSIPDDAKNTVARAALAINVLVAAFVAPSEAADAGNSYYKWYSQVTASNPAIEASVAPKALPAPKPRVSDPGK